MLRWLLLDLHLRGESMLRRMDALMSIGEFSGRCGMSAKRLRTYADGGLLVPAAVDPATGYRYYSPCQVTEARLIELLRAAGMPLAEIRQVLAAPSADRIDDWSAQVETDAAERRRALERARRLLAGDVPAAPDIAPSRGRARTMNLRAATRTDIGRVRENNEDAALGTDRLAVVADGMGGHPGGEVASAVAVSIVQAAFSARSLDELEAAVRAANRAIWDRASANPDLQGMASTVCAAGLTGDGEIALVHVGDSRAYLLRDGALRQVTNDHSVTADLVRRGELTVQSVADHPMYGFITRALGIGPDVELEASTVAAAVGDRILVCTDGLVNELSESDLCEVLTLTDDVDAAANELVDRALDRGGRDNVSVVVADVTAA